MSEKRRAPVIQFTHAGAAQHDRGGTVARERLAALRPPAMASYCRGAAGL